MIQGPAFASPASPESPAAQVDVVVLDCGSSPADSRPDRSGITLCDEGADSAGKSERVRPETGECRRDELERLGEEIAELAAQLHAATYRLLVRLRDFDERNGWNVGFLNCAHWLSWRTGIAPGAAREKVRVARSLADLPHLARAMERGEVSYSKVRALTRIATPANEGELLEVARHATAAQVETIVRAWRRVDRLGEASEERERHESRYLSLRIDDDGSYIVRGRLDPEVGALLERALEVAGKALYDEQMPVARAKEATADPDPELPTTASDAIVELDRELTTRAGGATAHHGLELPTPPQRRADALGLLVELAVGNRELATSAHVATPASAAPEVKAACSKAFSSEPFASESFTRKSSRVEVSRVGGDRPGASDLDAGVSAADDRVRREIRAARAPAKPLGRGARVQLVLHVDAEALQANSDAGQSVLAGGLRVPAETSRRLACDASRVAMVHDENGSVLDVGRSTRTVPPAIRRALDHRDRGCRFPGCWNRFTDAHHLKHWADGGETRLDNLLLLCRRHHRAVHEEGFRVTRTSSGTFTFIRPDGRPMPETPSVRSLPSRPVRGVANLDSATRPRIFEPSGLAPRFDLHRIVRALHRQDTAPEGVY